MHINIIRYFALFLVNEFPEKYIDVTSNLSCECIAFFSKTNLSYYTLLYEKHCYRITETSRESVESLCMVRELHSNKHAELYIHWKLSHTSQSRPIRITLVDRYFDVVYSVKAKLDGKKKIDATHKIFEIETILSYALVQV